MSQAPAPGLVRAVSRWQIVGLSINDVIGSGIYLLPAATAALLGPLSLWAVLLAGVAVALLVLCYAQAASYFDEPGGSYLYAREAFGRFAGFEIGWMIWLTRISSAAALSNGLADAVVRFWPAAAGGGARLAIVIGSLGLLTAINVIGVKSAARTGVALVIGKLVPLLLFVAIGVFYVDWSWAFSGKTPDPHDVGNLGEAALLLLFAYAGFENIPAAAGEYRNPRRDVPFALITMIVTVTLIYAAVQVVAQGTLPNVAQSATPLADAASGFGGEALALILTVGATISILGTTSNTVMLGPRFLFALAKDGYGPAFLARVHPRFRTPAAAILLQGVLSLALALSGSFVQLALLSMVTRLFAYIGTAAAVLVLARRYRDR
ncbi:APC family permease, partial [Xanthomonas sacchari]